MEPLDRAAALQRLDRFVGAWDLEAVFPNHPAAVLRGARSVFAWMKGRQLLVQRTDVPTSDAPDSIAFIAPNAEHEGYTQHYFDSRGVVRRYGMTFRSGVWKLLRDRPDDSPLAFAQRFTGTFADDGNTIRGRWEKSSDGSAWQLDFDLTYRRVR